MNNSLNKVVKYSSDRISLNNVTLDTYVTTDNLLQNKQGKVTAESLPPQGGNVTKYEVGDILIANIRPYLKKIWFANNSGGSSSDVLTFRVNENYYSPFVYYSLFRDDFFVHMMNGAKGTKMPRGDRNQILDFPIPFFNLSTQKAIAKVLSDLDAKIELNNKINAELESMAKLIYDYWFVQFDFPNEQGKPYKSSGGSMVYNKELKREIPKGWEVKKLVDEMHIQYGFPFSTKLFNKNDNGYPVIRIRDILNNSISISSTEIVDNKYKLEKGDLLIGMDGNFHMNFWDKTNCYLNQRSVRIRKKSNSSVSQFQALFSSKPYIQAREKNVSKTTVGHLSAKDIDSLIILIPKSLNLISQSKLFDSCLDKIILNRNENHSLTCLRNWLLPMLMNGQVNIN